MSSSPFPSLLSPETRKTRKTRIVCISDTHNQTPALPKGDVLIHAGDLTNQGSFSEVRRTVSWLEKAEFEVKIVVAGNHDITLDTPFYTQNWPSFHNQNRESPEACLALLESSPSITYLPHGSRKTVTLTSPTGPRTRFSVFGSPYSPAHGLWAFGYAPDVEAAGAFWEGAMGMSLETHTHTETETDTDPEPDSGLSSGIDIIVTHTPPRGHCDASVTGKGAGCEGLRRILGRVRPRVAVCGHLHEGRGVEIVRWKNKNGGRDGDGDREELGEGKYGKAGGSGFEEEEGVRVWRDPGGGEGNRKMSLVDLTGRCGFGSGGFSDLVIGTGDTSGGDGGGEERKKNGKGKGSNMHSGEDGHDTFPSSADGEIDTETHRSNGNPNTPRSKKQKKKKDVLQDQSTKHRSTEPLHQSTGQAEQQHHQRQIYYPAPARLEVGMETCVVNAAIMANSWGGPKRFNKPIVVDIELPVWDDDDIDYERMRG